MEKILILYGNCQITIAIKSYFESLNDIHLKIITISSFELIRNNKNIDYNLLNSCHIFIYQPINDSYGIYSSNNILLHLPVNCIKICVPFIYMDSFFPLIKKNIAHGIDGGNSTNENIILNKDIIINLLKIYNKEKIIDMYNKNEIDFNFEKRFIENIDRMKEKEKLCNIKIVDFILENYKKIKLFCMHHHPTKIIFDEIVKQIFNLLNIQYNLINQNQWNGILSQEEYPYSRYSINHFNFDWIKEEDNNSHNYYLDLINDIIVSYC